MDQKSGLRARKKQDTRRLILKCANALFHQKGFGATTLEEIACQAGVHKQTVLRYFGSKEGIALAFRQVALDKFKAGLADPGRTTPVLQYWRNFMESSAREVAERGDMLRYATLVESEPALIGASLALHLQYEDLVAAELSREAGLDPDQDIDAKILAGYLVSGNFSIARHLINRGELRDYVKHALLLVDRAISQFPERAPR